MLKTERELCRNTYLKEGDYTSVKDLLTRVVKLSPQNPLFAESDEEGNVVTYTAKNFYDEIAALSDGLTEIGLAEGHIAIVADNSYRYVVADTAVSTGVGVAVPIDKEAPDPLLQLLLTKCDADAVLCSARFARKIESFRLPKIKNIITIDRKEGCFPFWKEITDIGAESSIKYFENKVVDVNAPAKILFTSGTTGANKAVVLSQKNLAANAVNCMDVIRVEEGNTSMSCLPMHHATEINTHIMTRVAAGRLTYICPDMRDLMRYLQIFRPDIVTVVPMIANAFYVNILQNVKKAGKEEQLRAGIEISRKLREAGVDKTHEMFADIYKPFGGNLKLLVCGGAALRPEVVNGLNDLGIAIHNGFGITECGPLVSMNADTLHEPFSVGKPCPNLRIRLANVDESGIGELCVKGDSVSHGYYKDERATEQVFDAEGYFHTGDLAKTDAEGKIYLTGRKKNVIVTENGKNVCPEEIEQLTAEEAPYLDDVVVYGLPRTVHGKTQEIIVCGIWLDPAKNIDEATVKRSFEKVNEKLPPYKRIRYVSFAETPYERTALKKIKREKVAEKHNEFHEIRL